MALNQDLVAMIACPKCKGKLDLPEDESAFTCSKCRLRFAVVDGIPNFLIEEATSLEGK